MSETQAIVETKKSHKGQVGRNKRQQAVYGKALSEYGLTPKQLIFVSEYISNGGNGTQAAMLAYETNDLPTAKSIASENLTKPTVATALKDILMKQVATPTLAAAKFAQMAHGAEDERVQLRAAENIAKMHGMFKRHTETETTVKVVSITLPTNTGRKVLDVEAVDVANVRSDI